MMPHTVRLATYLCVTGLAGALLVGQVDPTPMPAAPEGQEGAFALGMIIGIVLGIAANAFVLWLIWKAYSRRNWARIILVGFVALAAVVYLPHIAHLWRISVVLGIGDGFFFACHLIGAVLFFAPDSNRWFNRADLVRQETV